METLKIKNKKENLFNLDGQKLYLLAWSIFLLGNTLTTTMFDIPGKIYTLCNLIPMFLIAIKILKIDIFTVNEFWRIGLTLAVGVIIAVKSGYTEPFFWLMMLVGAKDVSFKKILQVYVILVVSIIIMAFCASMLDVIENLQYVVEDTGKIRNSFGAMYTTDFASHIFSSILVIFYLLQEKIKIWHYVLVAVIAGMVFYFCNTRLDVGCIFILVFVFALLNITGKRKHIGDKYNQYGRWKKNAKWSMPFMAAIMYILTMLYSSKNTILVQIDSILSTRLKLGKQGLKLYGLSIFGQQVVMTGNGGTTKQVDNYFFVDCSYLYIFLRYGIIFLLIALAVYMLCCKKMENDPYFLVAIVLVSINCMIAHHIVELTYCPFALALFAAVPEMEGKDNRSEISLWSRLNL